MSEKRKSIIVTLTDEGMPQINNLASSLEKEGMRVSQILNISGVITGDILSEDIENIKSVQGVLSVEDDIEMQAS